jgi:carboxymethylenebutenolidase
MGQMISYKRPDGKDVPGYLAEPKTGTGAPGMVVIQEWWGLNDQIKGVADKLAGDGFRALVPDLYRGKVTLDRKEAEHLMTGLNFGDAAGQDVRGAVRHLKAKSSKVGVTGFCMGGALTILSAVNVPEADALACWYGYPPLEYVDPARIKALLMAHFAIDDVPFPIAKVDELEKKLRDGGVKFEFYRYKAKHAFANETLVGKNAPPTAEYSPENAKLAWQRTMEFLGKSLKN